MGHSLGQGTILCLHFCKIIVDGGRGDCGSGDASIYYLGKRKTSPIQNHNPSDLSFRPCLSTAGIRTTSNISFPDPSNSSHLCTPRTWYSLVCLIFQIQFPSLLIDLAYGAANIVIFAEYTLACFGSTPSSSHAIFSPVRLVALVCLTGILLLHGLHVPSGIRLQNILGFMKIGILLIVVGTGFIAFTGNLQEGVPRPGNFDSWERIWAGSTTGGSALCTCLYNVSLYFFKQFNPTMNFYRSCTASWA